MLLWSPGEFARRSLIRQHRSYSMIWIGLAKNRSLDELLAFRQNTVASGGVFFYLHYFFNLNFKRWIRNGNISYCLDNSTNRQQVLIKSKLIYRWTKKRTNSIVHSKSTLQQPLPQTTQGTPVSFLVKSSCSRNVRFLFFDEFFPFGGHSPK